jgi:hypothetical protein
MTDLADLRRIAEAQDAYGKWNTAPAWNRYYAARRAAQSPLRRVLGDLAAKGGLALALIFSWGLILAPIWVPLTR